MTLLPKDSFLLTFSRSSCTQQAVLPSSSTAPRPGGTVAWHCGSWGTPQSSPAPQAGCCWGLAALGLLSL